MIDNRKAIRALRNLEYEIEALECGYEHESLIDPEPAQRYIHAKLSRIKLGLYREDHDGDLLTVLEEIERILR